MRSLLIGITLLVLASQSLIAGDENKKTVQPAKSSDSAKQFDMVLSSSASPADRVTLNLFETYPTCQVHNIKLMSDRVLAAIGGYPNRSFEEYRQTHFPNANSAANGSWITDESKPSAWVS